MKWQDIFRRGIAPQLSSVGLTALREGLAKNDRRLLHGGTTMPPPLHACENMPCEEACPISYTSAFVSKTLLKTVGEVEEFFARVCFDCDQALGEPAACRWFLNFWDESEPDEARTLLLAEVDAELARRQAIVATLRAAS
jgi:hypothetical protein